MTMSDTSKLKDVTVLGDEAPIVADGEVLISSVVGESTGFRCDIHLQHGWEGNTFWIRTFDYLFRRGPMVGVNPLLQVQIVGGPSTSIVPTQDGQWHGWDNTMRLVSNNPVTANFYFRFHTYEPGEEKSGETT